MELSKVPQAIEAVLFVAGDPVSMKDLARVLEITDLELDTAIDRLMASMKNRGLTVKRYGEKLRLETRPEFAPIISALLQPVQKQSLSQTILETLAVIAYRQPVTRGEIEQIRGVKCDYSVQSLLSKGLIREAGRKDALGRPILYATTNTFLEHFGISDLSELPPLPETAPIPAEEPLVP